jgi:Leucine-rich repeat (LRR) protein
MDASYKHITNISGIERCKNLEVLDLEGNWLRSTISITDITPLQDLHHLKQLDLSSNTIEDLTPLSGLTGLIILDISNNYSVKDVKPLENLVKIAYLELWGNLITDIGPLKGLVNLLELDIHHNYIEDISPLIENPGLGNGDKLDLSRNPLSNSSIDLYIPQLKKRGVEVQR